MKGRGEVIGVTGPFASGKTTVADEFVALGAVRIDADEISHNILSEDRRIIKKIETVFGPGVMESGKVSREKLSMSVFGDREKLKALCEIMHPEIIKRVKRKIADASGKTVVLDAPLLFESGFYKQVDRIVVVTASERTCIKRAVLKGIPEEKARQIMASQISPEEKIKMADHVIFNEGNLQQIKEGVKKVWPKK
ncbi:MAG: dephospho-CoA kinase [Candidatus Omnitrophota bacterium]